MTEMILCALMGLFFGLAIVSAVATIIFANGVYDYLLAVGVLLWIVWAIWDFVLPQTVRDKVHSMWKKVVGKL